MIIIKLQGGLGNQMFQYALGKYLANKYQVSLKFDLNHLLNRSVKTKGKLPTYREYDLDIFGIEKNIATASELKSIRNRVSNPFVDKIFSKLFGHKKSYLNELRYSFSDEIFDAPDNVYLEGYWQSEKYFKPIESEIRDQFIIKNKLPNKSQLLMDKIVATNSVCVNVRRGDFVGNSFHILLEEDYYLRAEKVVLEKAIDPEIFVFSDDYSGFKYQDKFNLMTACKHFIIPNSTFAWWAAYLSNYTDKIVISPEKWFNDKKWNTMDLLLPDWIKL